MERLLPWLRTSGWAYVVLAVALAGLGWRVASRPASTQPPAPIAATITPREPTQMVVHVTGAVRRPGVYRVADGGRVQDAIREAGGPRATADLTSINLAAPLQDGQQVLVPAKVVSVGGGGTPAGAGVGSSGPVSLSTATVEQLDALDGIGPTLAARIVAWRDQHGGFASVDQLTDVPGIGQTRLDAIRAKLTP
jgi:competence protein ComEA